jgi:hypothetical protein
MGIQQPSKKPEVPHDNVNGGTITIDFNDVDCVYEMGLLNMDYASSLQILYLEGGFLSQTR